MYNDLLCQPVSGFLTFCEYYSDHLTRVLNFFRSD
jgi:hypothetical protein